MKNSFDRRQFLKLAVFVGAAGSIPAQALNSLLQQPRAVVNEMRRVLPAFSADATSFGRLIGSDGQPLAPPDSPRASAATTSHRWVMVIDLARCDGCRLCTEACNAMHDVPDGQEWIRVQRMVDERTQSAYWFPKPCFQCDDAPCAKVCPVSATYKREDGLVLVDQDRCIGCRYCMAACPYSARFFNWTEPPQPPEVLAQPYDVETNTPHRRGVVEKCIFCPGRLRQGELPACASSCPMGAIYVGDELEDVVTNGRGESAGFHQLIQDSAGYRYLDELATHPRVWYLPPRSLPSSTPPGAQPAQSGG